MMKPMSNTLKFDTEGPDGILLAFDEPETFYPGDDDGAPHAGKPQLCPARLLGVSTEDFEFTDALSWDGFKDADLPTWEQLETDYNPVS